MPLASPASGVAGMTTKTKLGLRTRRRARGAFPLAPVTSATERRRPAESAGYAEQPSFAPPTSPASMERGPEERFQREEARGRALRGAAYMPTSPIEQHIARAELITSAQKALAMATPGQMHLAWIPSYGRAKGFFQLTGFDPESGRFHEEELDAKELHDYVAGNFTGGDKQRAASLVQSWIPDLMRDYSTAQEAMSDEATTGTPAIASFMRRWSQVPSTQQRLQQASPWVPGTRAERFTDLTPGALFPRGAPAGHPLAGYGAPPRQTAFAPQQPFPFPPTGGVPALEGIAPGGFEANVPGAFAGPAPDIGQREEQFVPPGDLRAPPLQPMTTVGGRIDPRTGLMIDPALEPNPFRRAVPRPPARRTAFGWRPIVPPVSRPFTGPPPSPASSRAYDYMSPEVNAAARTGPPPEAPPSPEKWTGPERFQVPDPTPWNTRLLPALYLWARAQGRIYE